MKKLSIFLAVAVLLFAFAGVALADTVTLGDINGHWAQKNIEALVAKGIVSGYNGKFEPNKTVTRAEFAKMIVLGQGLQPANPINATFSDVKATDWFYSYVEAAAKAGLILGDNGKFRPNDLITREEVAAILVRAAGKEADAKAFTGNVDFKDAASISTWAKGYVAIAAKEGLVKGDEKGNFAPKANATKAEAATMVARKMGIAADSQQQQPQQQQPTVTANTITDLNSNGPTDSAESWIEFGGKRYDVAKGAEVFIGNTLATWGVLKKNTQANYTLNAAGKVNKIVVDKPSYNYVSGRLTSFGNDGDDYVVIENGSKIKYDVNKNDFKYAELNSDGDEATEVTFNTSKLNTSNNYIVVTTSTGWAYYILKISSSTVKEMVAEKGQDADGKFLVINGKKYYFKKTGSNYDVKNLDKDGNIISGSFDPDNADSWDSITTDSLVKVSINSDNKIDGIYVGTGIAEGITAPIFLTSYNDGSSTYYYVYIKVTTKSNDNYSGTEWIRSRDYYRAADVQTLVDDATGSNVNDPAKADAVVVADPPISSFTEMSSTASIKINGTNAKPYDVRPNMYVNIRKDADGKIISLDFTTGRVFGYVEGITKVNDQVTAVKINGKDYPYVGKSNSYVSSTTGYVSIIGKGTGDKQIKAGMFADAILNAKGEIYSFKFLGSEDANNGFVVKDARIVATTGASVYVKSGSDYAVMNLPANTFEVAITDGALTKYAWVTINKKASQGLPGTLISAAGTKVTLGDLKAGDNVTLVLASDLAGTFDGSNDIGTISTASAPVTQGVVSSYYFTGTKKDGSTPVAGTIQINRATYIFKK